MFIPTNQDFNTADPATKLELLNQSNNSTRLLVNNHYSLIKRYVYGQVALNGSPTQLTFTDKRGHQRVAIPLTDIKTIIWGNAQDIEFVTDSNTYEFSNPLTKRQSAVKLLEASWAQWALYIAQLAQAPIVKRPFDAVVFARLWWIFSIVFFLIIGAQGKPNTATWILILLIFVSPVVASVLMHIRRASKTVPQDWPPFTVN